MSGEAERCPHALFVPSKGQGHVSGCMLLARSLAALGFKVTFVYFSAHYADSKAKGRLLLPYASGTTEGGDPCNGSVANGGAGHALRRFSNGQSVIDLRVVEDGFAPGDLDKHFFVTPAMKDNLFNLILELREQGTPPTCLISDSFVPWTLEVAQRAGIPRVELWTANALSYLILITLAPLYNQGIFPETGSRTQWKRETPLMLDHIAGLPPISSEVYPVDLRFADLSHPFVVSCTEIGSCSKQAERILIHTTESIEADAFKAFRVSGIPAYGTGPLLQYAEKSQENGRISSQAEGKTEVNGNEDCFSWLNTQADSSVIYIAFGSFASLSAEDVQELALGIEASGSPFLWAIREDSIGGVEPGEVLPKGFRERTREKGMVMGWAPQVQVLAHKAIGGFLTHCGWNSTLESLWEGVPLLCCPRFAEQRLNLHYLCNVWGAGVELERTETGGIAKGFVEAGVKALMQEEAGRKARGKAQEVMEVARKTCQPGGQSYSNLQKFYDDMKVLCSKSMSQE